MQIIKTGTGFDKRADVSFGKDGNINAFDRSDAMARIAKYLVANEQPTYDERVSSLFSEEEKNHLINKFASPNVRLVIGQAMASPLKTFLEYKGVMRRALKVDPLGAGAIPIYDRDTEEISAEAIASQSAITQTRIVGERIMVPVFEIAANPTVKLREVKIRRFNIIDRIQVRTRQFMQEAEDTYIINLLNTASTLINSAVTIDTSSAGNQLGYIQRKDLVKLARAIEQHDLFAVSMFFSIYRYADIKQWGTQELDLVTLKQVIDTGLVAQLHGQNIYVTKKMPHNTVLCTSDPDYVGVMPVYQDIEVIPADIPWETSFGWAFTMLVGMACFNPKGVSKLIVSA